MTDLPVIDIDEIRQVMEDYADRGWTDGLPVMPVTESYLAEFLSQTTREPDEVLLAMPHLDRECTVRIAAINAAMAGCRPEYFPVVLAAWSALRLEGYVERAIWQSTTGTAPMLLVDGPIRERIGVNSRGNVFGSGFRANATIGRVIRLTAINAFGLRPHELDQATQGNPAKYMACIAENEEQSPRPPFHVEHGFDVHASTVTAMTMRWVVHISAHHPARAARARSSRHDPANWRADPRDDQRLHRARARARRAARPRRLGQGRAPPVRLRARGQLT